jgi:hypothetical protein
VLFDLRSRGRRRTVQVIYLGLALLMLGGLVLFGVGAGNGFGGLLNAFTNNGSGNAQTQVVNQAEKAALRATQQNPTSASAWSQLVEARWTTAGEGSNYIPATVTTPPIFTAGGKKKLAELIQAWQKYQTLTKSPDSTVAILAARAYGNLGNYAAEATVWEQIAQAQPSAAHWFYCLAASAYAAKQTRKGDLAAAKALSLVPKLQRFTVQQQLKASKTDPTIAQQC